MATLLKRVDSTVVPLSGGIDSGVALCAMSDISDRVVPVFFAYGQRTEDSEYQAAWQLMEWANERNWNVEPLRVIDYTEIFESMQTQLIGDDDDIVLKSDDKSGVNEGYVPIRNLHFISTAAGIAYTKGIENVTIGGVTGGVPEVPGNPDASTTFINAAQEAIQCSLPEDVDVRLHTPFKELGKDTVIRLAKVRNYPLDLMWSCYQNEYPDACGVCSACHERERAFELVDIVDDPLA